MIVLQKFLYQICCNSTPILQRHHQFRRLESFAICLTKELRVSVSISQAWSLESTIQQAIIRATAIYQQAR